MDRNEMSENEQQPLVALQVPPGTTPTDLVSLLTAATATSPEKSSYVARRERLEKEIEPFLSEVRALETEYGKIRAKHAARARALRAIDWKTLKARVPEDLAWIVGANGRRMLHSANHKVIERARAAAATTSVLESTVFDRHQKSPGEVDAPDLRGTLDDLRDNAILAGGPFWSEPHYRRLVSHVKHHLADARRVVASAKLATEVLVSAEAALTEMLSRVELMPLASTGAPDAPRMMPTPAVPVAPATSYVSEYSAGEPVAAATTPDDLEVVKLRDGGARVGRRRTVRG